MSSVQFTLDNHLISRSNLFRHAVKFCKFDTGERFVLVTGRKGAAMEETTLFTMLHQRSRGLSPNTMMAQMRAVALFLDWIERQGIDLTQRIGSGDLFTIEELYSLRDHFRQHASGKPGVVSGGHFRNRMVWVRDYIEWHAQRVIARIPNADWQRAQAYRERLDHLVRLMSDGLPAARERGREGHPEEVQAIFLEAIRPGSPTNPFKPRFQKRNHALLLLYHEHGVRRAEPLKLTGEDLKLHGDMPTVSYRFGNDEALDPRVEEGRMKTSPRTLPIGENVLDALKEWIKDRKSFNAKRTPYVFVTGNGRPLALRAVNEMFQLLRARVPGLPPDLTTHHKRHDANDRLTDLSKDLDWDEGTEQLNRNYMFGWKKTSKQGEKYTKRRTREAAMQASLELQRKSREDRK